MKKLFALQGTKEIYAVTIYYISNKVLHKYNSVDRSSKKTGQTEQHQSTIDFNHGNVSASLDGNNGVKESIKYSKESIILYSKESIQKICEELDHLW